MAEATPRSEESAQMNHEKPNGRHGDRGKDRPDYLLLSPALFARVTDGGFFHKGVWGGVNGTLFPHYPDMTMAGFFRF